MRGINGGGAPPTILADGECLTATLERLRSGPDGEQMSTESLERLREQAQDLLSEVVRAYDTYIAVGEVGAGGCARASEAAPLSGDCPTGLLYGRIQSGKTAAMVVATAMAIDNGFRLVIVLTSNYTELVRQTATRFRALEGPLVHSSSEKITGSPYTWDDDAGNIKRHLASQGLVIVCAKQADHQRALLNSLRDLGGADYPTLILDDEADQASPDTTTAARAEQRASAPQHGSTTYRLTVENDAADELGESFREVLRHNIYLQVTATPIAVLLQNITSPLRPHFASLLEPGTGYTGGERFFLDVSKPFPVPLVEVADSESGDLAAGVSVAPLGLARAISFFLVASAAHAAVHPAGYPTGYKFLCHTSPRTADHETLSQLIRDYIDGFFDMPTANTMLAWAYSELQRSIPDPPPFEHVERLIRRRIHLRRVLTVNSNNSALEFGSSANFMVGGNILGRGLTIKNLLVTYYLRSAKTTQMDTMLQHARMYGYREPLMPYTRVFLPETLAVRFNRLHDSETALRLLLRDPDTRKRVPVQVAGSLRPTRRGVLDVGCISAYTPGQQIYPTDPQHRPEDLGNTTERITTVIERLCGGAIVTHEFLDVSIGDMAELIRSVRTEDQEAGDWDVDAIARVLGAISEKHGGQGRLYIRNIERTGPRLPSGTISGGAGGEHNKAKAQQRPVLFMMRESGAVERNWSGVPFWHPTIVFPSNMEHWIFNFTRR